MRTLTQSLGDLASAQISGASLTKVSRALSAALPANGQIGYNDLRGILESLVKSGVTNAQLDATAAGLGVTIRGSDGALIPRALQQLSDALRDADLSAYVDSFAGSLERLQDTLTAEGITDPIEILTRRIAALSDAKTGFPALADALQGVDVSTAEGRASALDRVRALFSQVQGGTLGIEQFGGLSINDARKALVDLIATLRDPAAAGSTGTGGFNESRSITEVTGSRLAGLLGSANTYLSQIATDIAVLRAAIVVAPPTLLNVPSLGALSAGAGGGSYVVISALTINLTLTRELLGADAGTASALGDTLGRSIGQGMITEIDQQLRNRELRQRLLTGSAVLT